jgi:hypothetical protein
MIPHRMPGSEIFGNGLKQRVTTCRKRLRVSRHLHKVHLSVDEPPAFTAETTASFPPEYSAVRESLISGGAASEFRHQEAWLQLEQEVGVT